MYSMIVLKGEANNNKSHGAAPILPSGSIPHLDRLAAVKL